MMTSHGKLRREKGSLAEYESQMKGEAAPDVHVCVSCASEPSVALCVCVRASARSPACMNACWTERRHSCMNASTSLCTVSQTQTLNEGICACARTLGLFQA